MAKVLIGNFKGPQGIQGPKGDTGAQGPTGATGATGAKGEKGDTGAQGPAGAAGAAGQRGSLWYTGTAVTGTSTTAAVFAGTGIANALVGDMYLNTSTSGTYRCTVAGAASAAKWTYAGSIKGQKGDTPSLTNNLLTTVAGTALDAVQGKALNDKITEVNRNLSETINSLIKTERVSVTANNTTTAAITLSSEPTLVISVYADGGSPVVIDRISSPTGNNITLHFRENLTADTRFKVVYV